ncbi:hypothetical protein GCM10027058_29640 [Microbacterium neimengense]
MKNISPSELDRIARTLSSRDWRILKFLSAQKFASTTHLRRLCFTQHATTGAATRACLRAMERLLERRLVSRLERRVGGVRRGSAGFIWHLDVAGERLTRPAGAPKRHVREPSIVFLEHTLAVTDTVVALQELADSGGPALAKLEVETAAWRRFLGPHGVPVVLKPDLYAQLSSEEYDDHWYIEVDRGTESLPVLLTKSRMYATYRGTHAAQAEHGVFPRVVWIVPTQRRVARLEAAIHADPNLPDRIFTCITPEELPATLRGEPSSPEQRKEEP